MSVEHVFKWRNGARTERLTPIKAIHRKCFDCVGWEVSAPRLIRECEIRDCALWPFRLGKDPSKRRGAIPQERCEEARKRMLDLRAKGRLSRKTNSFEQGSEAISGGPI